MPDAQKLLLKSSCHSLGQIHGKTGKLLGYETRYRPASRYREAEHEKTEDQV
jgi:hypothetical protein